MTPEIPRRYAPSAGLSLVLSFIIFGALALGEFWTPPYFGLTPFYLLNVALVSWACGRTWGLFFALLASNFKALNDTVGHAAGDDALSTVAAAAKAMLRISDRSGRIGGDEFALVFPDTDGVGAVETINKLRRQLDERMKDKGYAVMFSFGGVTFASPPGSPRDVLALCDALMYEAKSSGKRAMVHRECA